jgi:hypothetical protein
MGELVAGEEDARIEEELRAQEAGEGVVLLING